MVIGLCSALKMNQWLGSGAAQPMAGKPARMGGASGYIMWAFAKAPHISSPSATTTRSLLYETRSRRRWTSHRSGSRTHSARPTSRFSAARCTCSSWSTDPCRYPATLSSENSSIRANFFALLQRPHRFCHSCRAASVFQTWVPPTLKQHSPGRNLTTAVTWVSSLHSRLTFLSESNPVPRALPLFSSQGPRKKQRGRGSQRSEMS